MIKRMKERIKKRFRKKKKKLNRRKSHLNGRILKNVSLKQASIERGRRK